MTSRIRLAALIAAGCLNACGGGGGGGGPAPTYTVGGNVAGLTGTLVLQLNGGADITTSANAPFTFSTALPAGSVFDVTVLSQPATQTCAVANAGGAMPGANVTTVAVTCSTLSGFSIAGSNDPFVSEQWHLLNTGTNKGFSDTAGTAGIDINVDPVFGQGYSGAGVTVAVVDSGLEILHEDLFASVVPGGSWNFNNSTTDPTNTVATDLDHGTSVSGLIAMARNNALGGVGVAPGAKLKAFNILSVPNLLESQFLAAIGASASNPNSVDVAIFNQSFGIETTTPEVVPPAEEAQYLAGVTSLRGGKGAIYVKASGNGFNQAGPAAAPVVCPSTGLSCENANFDPDNTLPYQIVVGAVNASGIKASYSTAGSAIWVSAPGGEFGMNISVHPTATTVERQPAMVTTDQSGCAKGLAQTNINTSVFNNGGAGNTLCNYTNRMNGTSSATPVTVGVIALILEANPALTWRDVKHILASTARKIDATGGAVDLTLSNGMYSAEPGWIVNHAPASQFSPNPFNYHNWYGFGMVDASAAVTMAKSYTLGQLGTFTNTGFIASGTLNLPIPDNSVTGASNALNVPANPVSVIEAVQIRVNATHTFDGDLGIELTSPSGTRSVLKNVFDGYAGADNLTNQVFLSNAFYGENPAGPWTIKVVDGIQFITGTLTNWAIRVYGH
jgi:subtilisin-like proprotein convertase family protein